METMVDFQNERITKLILDYAGNQSGIPEF